MFRFLMNAFDRLFRRGRWRTPRPKDIPLFEMYENPKIKMAELASWIKAADIRKAKLATNCSEDNDTVCDVKTLTKPDSSKSDS